MRQSRPDVSRMAFFAFDQISQDNGKPQEGLREARQAFRRFSAAFGEEANFVAVLRHQKPITVPLGLMRPVRSLGAGPGRGRAGTGKRTWGIRWARAKDLHTGCGRANELPTNGYCAG